MDDVEPAKLASSRKILAGAAILVSLGVHLMVQAGMYLWTVGWSIGRFRAYFEHDQLGYLAIVKNFSEGEFAAVEPDTQTGSNTYPRLYYEAIGFLARVLGLDPIVAWNVFGMAAQLALVAGLAAILIGFSRRWWTGLLAPLPFMIGTFSMAFGPGWYTGLASHAVIWGPFGILHSLNGESVSLSIACLSVLALGWLWLRPHEARTRVGWTIAVSATIGLLGNVQTYSFIATVYFLAFILAIHTLIRGRHRVLAVVSVLLLPVVFLAGPTVSAVGGQLPTLVFGLLPAIPGIVALIVKTRGAVALYVGAAVLGAAPQVISTVVGLVTGDPFLVYRVASNSQLGVPVGVGLISGLALMVPLLCILIAAVVRRRALWAAYAFGGAIAWLLLATNDRWGANAEPYRLWMDVFFLLAATILPMAVLVVQDLWQSSTSDERAKSDERVKSELDIRRRRFVPRWITSVVCIACLSIVAVSLGDWWRFYNADIPRALMTTNTATYNAATALAKRSAAEHPGTLLMVGPCLDPRVLKVTSGVPVAYFHLGMAWPDEVGAVRTIIGDSQKIDFAAAEQAQATQVITDSACGNDWGALYSAHLVEQHSESYTSEDGSAGTITVWGIR